MSLKRYHFLFLFFLLSCSSYSQEQRTLLYSNIIDKLGPISNVHIINTNTNQGTFTNENGEFRIYAKPNDSLKISFVGYETKIIKVEKRHFGISTHTITLIKTYYDLDEVEIKNHSLEGILSRDLKKTPVDISIVKSKGALDFSMIDFDKTVIMKIDDIDRGQSPDARLLTDPTRQFEGASVGMSLKNKTSERLKELRKDIAFKEEFPKKLLSELSEQFFFDELQIPVENYHHFLNYCEPLHIEKLYKQGKIIDVIRILIKEHDNYLKTLNHK